MIMAIKEINEEITKDVPTTGVSRHVLPLHVAGSDDHIPKSAKQAIETKDKTIRFVPIYGKYAVRNFFGEKFSEVIDNFECVMGHAEEDVNFPRLLNEILNGNLFFWVIFCNNKYAGFMTASHELTPLSKRYFDVRQLYIKVGEDINAGAWLKAMEILEIYCKRWQFEAMRMKTKRKGWEKKLKKFGWKQSYIEYVKDIGD